MLQKKKKKRILPQVFTSNDQDFPGVCIDAMRQAALR
jgi:hypothetical protein